jgi:hypothetical protein
MRPRIAVCNLGVSDLARARRFYEGMGFVARPESSERAVFFQLEWSWLSLFPRERLATLCGMEPDGAGFPGFCFSHNVTSAKEVDEVLARAVELGGSVVVPSRSGEFGRIGYFADPDGFRWEVAYTPKWWELTA